MPFYLGHDELPLRAADGRQEGRVGVVAEARDDSGHMGRHRLDLELEGSGGPPDNLPGCTANQIAVAGALQADGVAGLQAGDGSMDGGVWRLPAGEAESTRRERFNAELAGLREKGGLALQGVAGWIERLGNRLRGPRD